MRIPRAFAAAAPLVEEQDAAVLAELEPVAGPGWQLLPCNLTKQEKTEWCWVAVAQAVDRAHKVEETQCNLARALIPTTCGTECSTDECNSPQPLANLLKVRQRLVEPILGRIKFDAIKAQIEDKALVCARLDRPPNGHFVVICGYSESGGQKIAIIDPSPDVASGPQSHDYTQFLIRYDTEDGGKWDQTYLTKRPPP